MSTPLPLPNHTAHMQEPAEIPDLEPEPQEIVQEEQPYTAIKVDVCGPVRSQGLPARSGGYRSYLVSTTAATRILARDPRRKRAVITVHDNTDAGTAHGVYLGGTQAEAQAGQGYAFQLPFTVRGAGLGAGAAPLEITHVDEVWAIADGGSVDLVVSVLNEQWTY